MTVDLTSIIQEAKQRSPDWSTKSVWNSLKRISQKIENAQIEWDEGSGEDWGRVLSKGEVCAIVYRNFPLVIVLEKHIGSVSEDLENVVVVDIQDFETRKYRINKDKINSFFPPDRWSDTVSPGNFSIRELWWTTV